MKNFVNYDNLWKENVKSKVTVNIHTSIPLNVWILELISKKKNVFNKNKIISEWRIVNLMNRSWYWVDNTVIQWNLRVVHDKVKVTVDTSVKHCSYPRDSNGRSNKVINHLNKVYKVYVIINDSRICNGNSTRVHTSFLIFRKLKS